VERVEGLRVDGYETTERPSASLSRFERVESLVRFLRPSFEPASLLPVILPHMMLDRLERVRERMD
jgi:hypothetical protein